MIAATPVHPDPRMKAAIVELRELISASYPETTSVVDREQTAGTVCVTPIVDVDDPDEVIDCFIDRVLTFQVDEGLPLHVVPVRAPARRGLLHAASRGERPSRSQGRRAV